MTATINASTSSGVVVTSDTSGSLALQTANTTAMTINSSQVVNFANAPTVAGSALGSGTVNSGTAYQLAYYASTGTAVSTLGSLGTSGQVLTSGGAGVAPSWSTPSGGAWTKIATINGSSMTPYGVFSGLSGYEAYYMVVSALVTGSGLADILCIQFGYGGGTYITSSIAFSDTVSNQNNLTTDYQNNSSALYIGNGRQIAAGSTGKMTAQMLFTGMVTGYPSFTGIYGYHDGYSATGVVGQVGGYLNSSNAPITNLRCYFFNGNGSSGTITLYGLTT
jgi:hypothetical protein